MKRKIPTSEETGEGKKKKKKHMGFSNVMPWVLTSSSWYAFSSLGSHELPIWVPPFSNVMTWVLFKFMHSARRIAWRLSSDWSALESLLEAVLHFYRGKEISGFFCFWSFFFCLCDDVFVWIKVGCFHD